MDSVQSFKSEDTWNLMGIEKQLQILVSDSWYKFIINVFYLDFTIFYSWNNLDCPQD